MFKLLGGLSVYFKYQPIRTDNAVFRLHNVFTTVLLLTCSMIITATQYVGQPIQCIVNGLPVHVVNTFCWITSTFTMPDAFAREVSLFIFLWKLSNDYNFIPSSLLVSFTWLKRDRDKIRIARQMTTSQFVQLTQGIVQ